MACSICREEGHNKMTCKAAIKAVVKPVKTVSVIKDITHAMSLLSCKDVKTADDKITNKMMAVENCINNIAKNTNKDIILLRNREVIQWLFGDLSFLEDSLTECKTKKDKDDQCKKLEDKWGQNILKTLRRPDLKLDKQWTNKFGEHLGEELYMLLGKKVSCPAAKEGKQPDLEVDDSMIEIKAQTYFTTGTAGEKILGVPFKYAEIPDLYGKPLKIVCMGGAEKVCREHYGNLPGDKCSPQKKKLLEFFKTMNIEYIGATDILKGLC
jgi:hypothetical protein